MFFAESLGFDSFAQNRVLRICNLEMKLLLSLLFSYLGYISIKEIYSKESRDYIVNKKIAQNKILAKLYP